VSSYVDIDIIPGGVDRATLGAGVGYLIASVTTIAAGSNPFKVTKGANRPPEYDRVAADLQSAISTILAQTNASELWVYQVDDAGTEGSDVQIVKETMLPRPDGVKTKFWVSQGPIKSIDEVYINLNKEPGDADYGDHLLFAGQDDDPSQGGSSGVITVNQGTKTFTVSGDHVAEISTFATVTISGSTGNDGTYTVVSATLNVGDTDVVVSETIPDPTADGVMSWGSDLDHYDVVYSPAGSTNPTGDITVAGKTWEAPSGKIYNADLIGADHFPPPGSSFKCTHTKRDVGFENALRDASTRQGVRFVCVWYGDMDALVTSHYSGGTDGSLLKDHILLRDAIIRANAAYRFMHGIAVVPPHISDSDNLDAWGHSSLLPSPSTVVDWKNLMGVDSMILVGGNSALDYGIVLMGMLMGLPPQSNPQLRPTASFVCDRYDESKLTGLEDAHVCIMDLERFYADTIVCRWGYTCSSDAQRKWIDDSRVKMELQFNIKSALTIILGSDQAPQNVNGTTAVRSVVKSVFDTAKSAGLITGYPTSGRRPFCNIPIEAVYVIPPQSRTPEQQLQVDVAKITRVLDDITCLYNYAGAIRKINMRLGAI